MREIKFRAWNTIHKKMTEPFGLDGSYSKSKEYQNTIMQFTGLLDRNGKEIYEGDIVGSEDTGNFEVEWSTNARTIGWLLKSSYETDKALNNVFSEIRIWYSKDFSDRITLEIIGNIYQDSQLLESNK